MRSNLRRKIYICDDPSIPIDHMKPLLDIGNVSLYFRQNHPSCVVIVVHLWSKKLRLLAPSDCVRTGRFLDEATDSVTV